MKRLVLVSRLFIAPRVTCGIEVCGIGICEIVIGAIAIHNADNVRLPWCDCTSLLGQVLVVQLVVLGARERSLCLAAFVLGHGFGQLIFDLLDAVDQRLFFFGEFDVTE